MAKGLPRDPQKERFWRDHLKRWQNSGLTIRDYCARHRVAEPSFYGWRRTLAQRGLDAEAAAVELPVTFVPVEVQPDLPAAPPILELVLANGRLLRIPPGSDPDFVRDLLTVLEDEPC
jgi:transposase